MATESLIVYGARCVWWDDISKAGTKDGTKTGLPCCPHCGGVLFQTEPEKWWHGVDARTALVDSTYREFIEWMRGKCFPDYGEAHIVWEATRT